MKTALITTTINVPRVLELYRKLNSEARFFVALDQKTPPEAYEFCNNLPNYEVLQPTIAKYESDAFIGHNSDSRRNFAMLAALEWGADLIVSIDDDMIPQGDWDFACRFEFPFDGLQLGAKHHWFDAGVFSTPPAPQRGLPPDVLPVLGAEHVVGARIGAAQGIIFGVPDTDAVTAMSKAPRVLGATDILRNGFVVHPQAFAVFNSQFTAFRRELAPAFAQFYNHQGRNTDIFASLLMRRIMREKNLYTYFGPPMAFHARTSRPLFKDLKAEMWGLEHISEYAGYLHRAPLLDVPVVDQCRVLTEGCNIFSDENKEAAMAWYNDVERALG